MQAAMPWPLGGISCSATSPNAFAMVPHQSFMVREVVNGQRRSVLAGERRDALREGAAEEGFAPGFRDGAQARREGLVDEELPRRGRAAPGQEGLGEARLACEHRLGAPPYGGDHRRYVKAALGEGDRGFDSAENDSWPKRADRSTQALTAPGTVTLSQPRSGIAPPGKRSGVQSAGERPEALRPCSARPSHRIAKASLPRPLPVGSTTTRAIAAASAASTALPPRASMVRPAWAASGCEVATMLRAKTGDRVWL